MTSAFLDLRPFARHVLPVTDGNAGPFPAVAHLELRGKRLCCVHLQFRPSSPHSPPHRLRESLMGVVRDHLARAIQSGPWRAPNPLGPEACHTFPPWVHHPHPFCPYPPFQCPHRCGRVPSIIYPVHSWGALPLDSKWFPER